MKKQSIQLLLLTVLLFEFACSKCDKDSVEPKMPTKGLVAFYPFDGNAQDQSASGLDGQLSGAPEAVSDRKGNADKALYFDGTDDFVSIPFGLNFPDSFSIAFWVKYDNHVSTSNPQTLFSKGEECPDGNPNYEGHSYDLTLGGEYSGAGIYTGENHLNGTAVENEGDHTDERIIMTTQVEEVKPDSWFFVVWAYDSKEKRFQISINGSALADSELPHFYEKKHSGNYQTISKEQFGPLHQTTSALTIGAIESHCGYQFHYSNFLKGAIDDVRFYNRSLTNEEIDLLFHE